MATLRGFVELDLFCLSLVIEVDGSVDGENNEVELSRCWAIKMPQLHATWQKKEEKRHPSWPQSCDCQ